MPARFHPGKIVLLGLGLGAAQFAWVIYNTYVPIFLQAGSAQFDTGSGLPGFGLSATQTGILMTLDNLAALLLQPLCGALSDHTASRFGRRMPYLLLGMPVAALGMALIPVALAVSLTVFIACLLAMVVAMALWRAPLFALMADLTPAAQHTQANGILNLMAGLGGVLAFGAGSLLYTVYRPLPFWLAALLFLVVCAVIVWQVREPAAAIARPLLSMAGFFHQLKGWFSSLSLERRRNLLFLSLAVFCYMLGFHPIEAFFSSYGVTVLKLSEAASGLVLSAAYIAFIVFALPAGILAARIGRRRCVLAGLGLFALALLAAFFTPHAAALVLLMALGGAAWALIDINAFPMVLDSVPGTSKAAESGAASSGAAYGTTAGIYFVATTLAATIGPILNGWLIDLSGRDYRMIFLIGPAFFVLAFIFLLACVPKEAERDAGERRRASIKP